MKFDVVIGLEVHAQVNTKTKIFCGCSTEFGADANTQTCPVCLGLPGVLPVLNEKVLEKSVLAGLAMNCDINRYSKFDRKNYFYPDLPKAYQISQFDKPICIGGYIRVGNGENEKKIRLNRIHMEEDAGKSIHSDDPAVAKSFVDFNRTGVPLMEIVSEPDMSSASEVYEYLTNLKQTLKYINVSDCNMEEGSLRCDVNISLKPEGSEKLGDKVEIKNMNSFKAVKAAIEYEISRQTEMLEDGEKIVQETRLWNPDKNRTYSMRSKEEAHDYRYFPDPDLPPVICSEEYISNLRNSLPELPEAKKNRFTAEYGLSDYDAGVLTSVRQLAGYFEEVIKLGINPKKCSNWITSELLGKIEDAEKIDSFSVRPASLAKLLKLIDDDTISGKIAKTVFAEMIETSQEADDIVEKKGLRQVTDTAEIEKIIDDIIAANPQPAEDFKNGNDKAIGFLVGQAMKLSQGKANPQIVNRIITDKLR
ncbi:MAG: Asp-tRNA(Asn)/Glu-tRNA(Gln) amidotransferase subunit GatB [Spirochaetes bacterium]|nr:Asp-tRNA(Asn)/Glu-tRNA(Gln) amidotransferase subunit GatB [Spirochaetota bacterium]